MKKFIIIVIVFQAFIRLGIGQSQVFVSADSATDPYALIKAGGYGIEETTLHTGVKHITQMWDSDLGKYVFVFTMHKDIDGDGGERIDRQRLEIKTYGPSPANMKAGYGEIHTYRWKFKLDANFQPSPNFYHIHQIKAGDGDDAGAPLMTITPRYGSNNTDKLQLIHTGPTGAGESLGTVKEVPLSSFKGVWVEAYERIKYTEDGSYQLVIRRVSDDAILLTYSNNNINMWRTPNTTFIRPKFGIYRSINNLDYLRDESVCFADWMLVEGDTTAIPQAPVNLNVNILTGNQADLTWTDKSGNEELFRIERSVNQGAWLYLASVHANNTSYSDRTFTTIKTYQYRVRAENTYGNSGYSTSDNISTLTKDLSEYPKISYQHNEPFQRIDICYTLKQTSQVNLTIFNLQGQRIESIVDGKQNEGYYKVPFYVGNLSEGIYIARMIYNGSVHSIKILLN